MYSPIAASVILTSARMRNHQLASDCPSAALTDNLKLGEVDVADAD
jgi:hypothetical protein